MCFSVSLLNDCLRIPQLVAFVFCTENLSPWDYWGILWRDTLFWNFRCFLCDEIEIWIFWGWEKGLLFFSVWCQQILSSDSNEMRITGGCTGAPSLLGKIMSSAIAPRRAEIGRNFPVVWTWIGTWRVQISCLNFLTLHVTADIISFSQHERFVNETQYKNPLYFYHNLYIRWDVKDTPVQVSPCEICVAPVPQSYFRCEHFHSLNSKITKLSRCLLGFVGEIRRAWWVALSHFRH